jgi:uncharacterized protein YwqG
MISQIAPTAVASTTEDLSALTDDDLIQHYLRCVQRRYATEHLGLHDRIERKEKRILEILKSRADGPPRLLLHLSRHLDASVQLAAALNCKSLDPETYHEIMPILAERRDRIGREAQSSLYWVERHRAPPTQDRMPLPRPTGFVWRSAPEVPTGITSFQLQKRVRGEFPGALARRILSLAQPTIGVWPRQRRENADPMTSRLGGMPFVPENWTWPSLEGEPMLFVGQINCAELTALPSARAFPKSGLLAFFGDHDFLNSGGGDWRTAGGAVFHWTATDTLRLATEPSEDFLQLPRCGLAFYETHSLPHPRSEEIERLPLARDQQRRYRDLHDAVRAHSAGKRHMAEFKNLKLLGWPDLMQYDFLSNPDRLGSERLLFQLGSYDDGTVEHHWATGGLAYFLIPEQDLAAGRFDRVRFEAQF